LIGFVGWIGLRGDCMATIKRFEDLDCWKDARKLVKMIYDFTKKGNFEKDYELKAQIKRSAISVMANIAEGFHRKSNREFMRFLDYSRASLAETLSHLYVALDQNYIDDSELQNFKNQAEKVWKKINNFITYLKNHNTIG
jgi:four helix bundle protein